MWKQVFLERKGLQILSCMAASGSREYLEVFEASDVSPETLGVSRAAAVRYFPIP